MRAVPRMRSAVATLAAALLILLAVTATGREAEDLQAALGPALTANRPGPGTEHAVIARPSNGLGESLLSRRSVTLAGWSSRPVALT